MDSGLALQFGLVKCYFNYLALKSFVSRQLQVLKGTTGIFCFARIKCNVQLADLFLAQLSRIF